VFDYRQWVGWDFGSGPDYHRILNRPGAIDEIQDSDLVDVNNETVDAEAAGSRYDPPDSGLRLYTSVAPLKRSELLFSSAEHAFRFVCRPVCSLEQYIDFYAVAGRGDANADPIGRGRGIRVRTRKEDNIDASYYDVIRQFVGGPGVEPGSKVADGLANPDNPGNDPLTLTVISPDSSDLLFSQIASGQKALFQDLPDSRRDWQKLLLAYLRVIEGDGNSPDVIAPPLE